jgi:hypothetical protein
MRFYCAVAVSQGKSKPGRKARAGYRVPFESGKRYYMMFVIFFPAE